MSRLTCRASLVPPVGRSEPTCGGTKLMTTAVHRPLAGWHGLGALRLPLVAAAVWCLSTVLVAGVPPLSVARQAGAPTDPHGAPPPAAAPAAARGPGRPVPA